MNLATSNCSKQIVDFFLLLIQLIWSRQEMIVVYTIPVKSQNSVKC